MCAMKGDSKVFGLIHPKSRRAEQKARAARFEHDKAVRGRARAHQRYEDAELLRWLQEEMSSESMRVCGFRCALFVGPSHLGARQDKSSLSYYEIVSLLTRFVSRVEEDLMDAEQGPNGGGNRALELRMLLDAEREKLATGYQCPDLRQKKTLRAVREWDRSPDTAQAIATATFKHKEGTNMDVE